MGVDRWGTGWGACHDAISTSMCRLRSLTNECRLCLAYISRLTPKCRMICRLTPKSCVMYAGLRLAKTFVCCCPDQLNKRLTDSKIESVRRKLCSVRAKSTFVVASSQSQHVAFMTRLATVTFAINHVSCSRMCGFTHDLPLRGFSPLCCR